MPKSRSIPKATKYGSGRTAKASTKGGKEKEAILGEARWGKKIIIKRFQCDVVIGEGANGKRCTKTFTRNWDMNKHRMLHDPEKQGWHFCKHRSCCYATPQKSVLEEHARGVHGHRELIFCTMRRPGTRKMCGYICHLPCEMSHHRTDEHGGATNKKSPRLTAIEGRKDEYTIPHTFKTKIKLRLPSGIYFEDEVPPLPLSVPVHPPSPSPTLRVPRSLPHHSGTPSQAPSRIPITLPPFTNLRSNSGGLELLAYAAEIHGNQDGDLFNSKHGLSSNSMFSCPALS